MLTSAATAGSLLNDALQGPSRRKADAIDRAILEMESRAREARDSFIVARAAGFVAEPWRIARCLDCDAVWPVEGMDLTDLLALACRRFEAERARGRAGHWTYSPASLNGFEAAILALVEMIMEDA